MLRAPLLLLYLLHAVALSATDIFSFNELHLQGDDDFVGVNCFAQHSQNGASFTWIGANDGLYRYDGAAIYKIPSRSRDIKVTAISEVNGTIWAGTAKGEILQLWQDSLLPFPGGSPIEEDRITSIAMLHQTVWLGSASSGLWQWDNERWTRFAPTVVEEVYELCVINSPLEKDTELLCVGTLNGLYVADGQGTLQAIKKPILKDEIIRSVKPAVEGGVWVSYDQNGFSWLSGELLTDPSPSGPLNDDFIRHYLTDTDLGAITQVVQGVGYLLLATEKTGLLRFEESDGSIHAMQPFDAGAKIYDLHLSPFGKLFVASNKVDIYTSIPRFSLLSGIDENVQAITADDSTIWYATPTGVFQYSAAGNKQLSKLPAQTFVTSLYLDKAGELWIGTFDKGLFYYVNGRLRNFTEEDGLANNSILSITGKGDSIFVGTFNGLTQVTKRGKTAERISLRKIETENSGSGRSAANYIYHLKWWDGTLWAGTDGHGIFKLKDGKLSQHGKGTYLEGTVIYSISGWGKQLLINTKEYGLLKILGNEVDSVLPDYFKNRSIFSFGRMPNGLVAIEQGRVNFLNVRADTIDQVSFDFPTAISGAVPNLNAVTASGDHLLIGTSQGILKLREDYSIIPASFGVNGPHLIEIRDGLGNNWIGKNKLPSRTKNLQFGYTANWHNEQDNLSYAYFVEGLQDGWLESRDRQLSFSGLRPGDYNFRLRLKEPSGLTVGREASYAFTIRTPFWQQWWFILAMLLLAGFLVVLAIRERDARILKAQQLEKEQIHTQYENLRNQVNPHFLFNSFNTLTSLIEEDQEVAVDYLARMSDFFRNILDFQSRDLIRLETELDILSDYLFLQKSRYETKLSWEVVTEGESRAKYIPPMSLQLLVENAIKHNIITSDQPLKIEITADDDSVTVSNNFQPRPHKRESTGIGLTNLSNKFALLGNGSLRVINENGTFSVRLPLSAENEI